MPRVTIVQEYVPLYREPLFKYMRNNSHRYGFELQIAAGKPRSNQSQRLDISNFEPNYVIRQAHFSVFKHQLTFRFMKQIYNNSDYVITEQARRNLDMYTLLFRKKRNLAMWGHGKDFVYEKSLLSSYILRLLTSRCDWFFGYTPSSVSAVIRDGFDANKTTTLWNTIDTFELKQNLEIIKPEHVTNFRKSFGSNCVIGLFIGALDESKRLDFLIESCDLISQKLPNFVLLLYGEGPERNKILSLSENRRWLHLKSRVTGWEKALVLKSADAILMPGRVGLIAVDSIMSKTPIITTNWKYHAPEFSYLNSKNSCISENSVEDYAKVVYRILGDSDELQRLSSEVDTMETLASIEQMGERFLTGISNWLKLEI